MFHFARRICVSALAMGAVFAQAKLNAQTNVMPPVLVTYTTGVVGIAEGQTAQLNALNPGVVPPAMGVICSGLLEFVGSDGTVVKSATVSVAPGNSMSISLDSVKDLALAPNERKQIHATLTIPPVPPPSGSSTGSSQPVTPACKLIGTLEIYNTLNGHTQVTLGTGHEVPSAATATSGS